MDNFIYINACKTTLAEDITESQTILSVSNPGRFPASIPLGQVLVLTIHPDGLPSTQEIVHCTAISEANLTVVRGAQSTAAAPWSAGSVIGAYLTAEMLDQIADDVRGHAGSGGSAHALATTVAAGFMSATNVVKLNGIQTGATNYQHPVTHSPTIIAQDINNRFATDAEKANWNAAKNHADSAHAPVDIVGALSDKKITLGLNNIILDASGKNIIVAPDNGTIVGTTDLSAKDFCEITGDGVVTNYWDGTAHQSYGSLKRVEFGMDAVNNVPITLPGIWRRQPSILVSPADIKTYSKNYVADQNLVCRADNIVRNGLSFTFTPKAFLRLTNGVTGTAISLPATASGASRNVWYYANSAARNTPNLTTTLTVSGSVEAYSVGHYYDFNDGNPVEGYFGMRCYVRVWIVVDGVERYVGEWTADQASTATWNFSTAVSGLPSGVHSYYFKVGFMRSESEGYDDILTTPWGKVLPAYETTNQSEFTSISGGTVNYVAIGD